MTLVRNRPSAEGAQLGQLLARLTDKAEADLRKRFPGHDERCKSCAFRLGTIPNRCAPTVMDALKCVMEKREFMCHEHFDDDGNPTELCAGWALAMGATLECDPIEVPWDYSYSDAEEKSA
jgi:hypothetical protein